MSDKIVSKFQCKECDDIFIATSEDFVSCKCGKCCVKPSSYSTFYKTDNGRGAFFKELECKTYYDKNNYIMLSRKTQLLCNILKRFKLKDGYYHFYESFDNSADGNIYLKNLRLFVQKTYCNNIETNYLELYINLKEKYTDEEVYKRLRSFYKLLNQVNKNEIDLLDLDTLKEKSKDWDTTQCQCYNHNFYF